jgi:MFS family permease
MNERSFLFYISLQRLVKGIISGWYNPAMLVLSDLERNIRTHLRHNLAFNLLDGAFFGLGFGFASFSTIIPLFVTHLTDSAILIGLAPAIHTIGWQLPQLFTAGHLSRARRYKPTVLTNTIHERVPFLMLAVIAWSIPSLGAGTALVLTFLALIWQGLGGGFTANAWTSMIAKIIPAESRGTFIGIQGGLVNLMISLAAVGAGYLLDRLKFPDNFAWCFLATCLAMIASYAAIAQTREPEDTDKVIPERETHFWQSAAAVMHKDQNFNWFLVARTLSQFATMGFGFYILFGLRHFNMDAITAGYLTASLTLAQTFANAGMGWLGDRWGHRSMLIVGALAAILSTSLAWFAPSLDWLYPVLILAGLTNVSIWTIGITFTVEFGSEAERPTYIGLSNTLIAPATILAPVLGGWLVDHAGFDTTFALSAFIGMLTAVILIFLVRDPRKVKKESV